MESNSIHTALSFDDVLIKPAQSSVLPNEAITLTNITKNIKLALMQVGKTQVKST